SRFEHCARVVMGDDKVKSPVACNVALIHRHRPGKLVDQTLVPIRVLIPVDLSGAKAGSYEVRPAVAVDIGSLDPVAVIDRIIAYLVLEHRGRSAHGKSPRHVPATRAICSANLLLTFHARDGQSTGAT